MHTKKHKNKNWSEKISISLAFILALFLCSPVWADTIDSLYSSEINLVKGELETLTVYSLTRLSLTDPSIVDIVSADDKQVLLIAKNPGQTTLFIWDEHGKRPINIYVYPQDLYLVRERIVKLLGSAGINEVTLTIDAAEGKIVVSGDVPDYKKTAFDQIIGLFSSNIISFSQVQEVKDLIQIDMQITELSQTLTETLGIDWNDSLGYSEKALPNFDDGTLADLAKISDIARTSLIKATVNALISDGKGRVLSKPRLVVVSGKEATFLVGGQIPIRTTTTTEGGTTQENVEFKSYGISMNITPVIKKNKIDVLLRVEISDVDTSTAGTSKSNVGFTTRSAGTQLSLDDAQTVILAGLIKRNSSVAIRKVPFLGDIPILGLIFRSKASNPANFDQEVVISLTPHILTSPGPGEKTAVLSEPPSKTEKSPDLAKENIEPSAAAETSQGMEAEADETAAGVAAAPASAAIPPEMMDYARSVQEKINQAIEYPKEALENDWEGTVKLGLLILRDGTLAFASIKESSGYQIFDDYTLTTAKDAAPYLNFPQETDLKELNLTIPIGFSLKKD